MGLFSSKPKHEIKSIEDAIRYDDKKFTYTTKSGRTYDDFPTRASVLHQRNGYWNIDDTWEMYAPRMVSMFENMNANLNKLVEQNQLLQERISNLEIQLSEVNNRVR